MYKCTDCKYTCKNKATKIKHEMDNKHKMKKYFDVSIQEW